MTRGAGPALHSYVEEVFQGCDKAHQSPLGVLSACAPFPPISVLPAAALPQPFLLVPLLHEHLSGKLHKPEAELSLVIKNKLTMNREIIVTCYDIYCSNGLFIKLTCLT